jgi:hypothetical protein
VVDGPHLLQVDPADVVDLGDLGRVRHAEGGRCGGAGERADGRGAEVHVAVARPLLGVLLLGPERRQNCVVVLGDAGLLARLADGAGGARLAPPGPPLGGLPPQPPRRGGRADEGAEPLGVGAALGEAAVEGPGLPLVQVAGDDLVRPEVVEHPAEVPRADEEELPHGHPLQQLDDLVKRRETAVVAVDELGEGVGVAAVDEKRFDRVPGLFPADDQAVAHAVARGGVSRPRGCAGRRGWGGVPPRPRVAGCPVGFLRPVKRSAAHRRLLSATGAIQLPGRARYPPRRQCAGVGAGRAFCRNVRDVGARQHIDRPAASVTKHMATGMTSYPGARPAARFRERLLSQVGSAENVEYLYRALDDGRGRVHRDPRLAYLSVERSVREFVDGHGRDAAAADPLAARARAGGGPSFWGEVRRLNALFLEDVRDGTASCSAPPPSDDLTDGFIPAADISRRIFEKTVLRPPGLETLNGPGPLWESREYQTGWADPTGRLSDGGAAGGRGASASAARAAFSGMSSANPYRVANPDGLGYRSRQLVGKTLMTPSYEEAGVGAGAPYDIAGGGDIGNRLLGDVSAWGDTWHASGSEFDRWRGIPVWQTGGRRFVDDDEAVEETLGLGDREAGGMFRKFDMSRMTADSVYNNPEHMVGTDAAISRAGRLGPHIHGVGSDSDPRDVAIGTVPPGRGTPQPKLAAVATGARYGYPV